MRLISKLLIGVCVFLLLGAGPSFVWANGGGGGDKKSSTPTPTSIAKKLLAKDKFSEALVILEKAVRADPTNANMLNLAGYAYRKIGVLKDAQVFYNRALAVNPEHTGALNYLGMLYVSTGQLDEAKALLVRLDDACFFSCDGYDTLKIAIKTGVVSEEAPW